MQKVSSVLFCFAKKERATGAPKTMTAVFGFSFGDRLCKEVKGSGALISTPDRTSEDFYGTFISFFYVLFCFAK